MSTTPGFENPVPLKAPKSRVLQQWTGLGRVLTQTGPRRLAQARATGKRIRKLGARR